MEKTDCNSGWGFSESWRVVLEVLGGLFGTERLGVGVAGGYVVSVMKLLDTCPVAIVFLLDEEECALKKVSSGVC